MLYIIIFLQIVKIPCLNKKDQSMKKTTLKGIIRMKRGLFNIICICMGLVSINCTLGFAEPVKKIAVFPFLIQAETDHSFLREGIESMIFTRLVSLHTLSLIEAKKISGDSPMDLSKAIGIGKKAAADFVLTGSVMIIGKKVSTDIRLTDIATGKTTLSFSRLGEQKEDVLAHVDLFCQDLVRRFSGNESDLDKEKISLAQNREDPKSYTLLKSRSFDYKIMGLTTASQSGKSKQATIVTDGKNIYAYDALFEKPVLLFEHPVKGNTRILGVDAADMDQDGGIEIYVTAIYENSGDLKSFVLEWHDGDDIQTPTLNEKWFLRVIDSGQGKKILIGQNRGSGQTLFKPGIYEMAWKNKSIVQEKKLNTPDKTILFGFTMGDILNSGKKMMVSFNKEGRLGLYDETGERIWISPEIYGGTENYISYDPGVSPDDRFHFYLPQRIFIADMDQNGKNELILASNHEMTGQIFSRMRYFDKGMIEYLSWNDIGFNSIFKTQEISGYVSDYAVGDFNGNGRSDILFSVVTGGNAVFGKKSSYLVLWEKSP